MHSHLYFLSLSYCSTHFYSRFLITLLLIGLSGLLKAADYPVSSSPASLQNQALSKELYSHPDWLRLLQYLPTLRAGYRSEVLSDSSFLSNDGRENPKQELIANISKMLVSPKADEEDNHPRCKFIARYDFLSQHLAFPAKVQNIECAKFEDWINVDEIESVSVVFASGYFRNPASFFGHPLLKFNRGKGNHLLDITLNNGAVVPDNENPISYVIKGVFGGYESAFSDTRFYQLNHSYSESDLRDLWHYELSLTNEEIKRLIYYSWELLDHRFAYKFFSKNCGYFLENLFSYAIGERISPRNPIYTVPSSMFFNLVQSHQEKGGVIKKIHRVPSRQSRFREKFAALKKVERIAVRKFIDTEKLNESLDQRSRIRIIDTLSDYYLFLSSREKSKEQKQVLQGTRRKLFAKRIKLSKSDHLVWPDTSVATAPHSGNLPSLSRASVTYNDKLGSGLGLRIRPVSYDLTDLDQGRVANSKLNMFNSEILLSDGRVRIRRFDLVDIVSLNISETGLPKDGGRGWGLRFGAELANEGCLNCLLAYAAGSAIKGFKVNDTLTVYGQAEARVHSKYLDSQFSIDGKFGIISNITSSWKLHLTIGHRAQIKGSAENETIISWQNRFGSRADSNFTFDVNHNVETTMESIGDLYSVNSIL